MQTAEIRDLSHQFNQNTELARSLTHGLDEHQLGWRPGPKRWSIIECIDHLNMIGKRYLEEIGVALENAPRRPKGEGKPFRYGLIGRLFVWSLEPPIRLRVPTTRAFLPGPVRDCLRVLSDFEEMQKGFQECLRNSDDRDLVGTVLRSPVNRHLKVNLALAFDINAAHERRHLWQVQQVRRSRVFPVD